MNVDSILAHRLFDMERPIEWSSVKARNVPL